MGRGPGITAHIAQSNGLKQTVMSVAVEHPASVNHKDTSSHWFGTIKITTSRSETMTIWEDSPIPIPK